MKFLSRKGYNLAINLVNKLSIIEILVFIKHYVDILVGCDSSLVTLQLFLVRRRFPFLDLQIRLLLPHIRTRHLWLIILYPVPLAILQKIFMVADLMIAWIQFLSRLSPSWY